MTGSSTKQAGAPRWSALQRWTLGVTSMAAFMAGMDALVVTTALPTIHTDLGAATSALSWTVAAYALGFAAVVLAGVALGDRYGRRRVFLTGLALFTLGSAGCALSPNVSLLIATRAIQGVGGGLAVPLSLVLISEVFPPQQRARAIGIWGAITGMAVAVAPLVGGAIVSGLAWRWIFWVNVPIGVAVLAAGLTRLARSPRVSARIDLAGMLLGAFAVGAIAYAVQEGPTVGWASAQVLTAGIGGLVLAGATMAWERRCAYPMVPPGLLANRSFAAAAAGRFCLGVTLYGAGFLFPQFLQLEHHYSRIRVGIAFLAWTGVSPFVAPIAGQIAQRRGERTTMVAGMAAMTVSVLALAVFVRPDSSYLVLVGPLLVAGVGTALAFPGSSRTQPRAATEPSTRDAGQRRGGAAVSDQWAESWLRPNGPRPAGVCNCLLGGTDNNPADRAAAAALRAVLPEAGAAAWANRGFHQRAARWMARQGIGQFIDLGCGLPATTSTCAAVQDQNPSARVLYVDHDPVVIVHASAQLTHGTTSALLADLRDPGALLAAIGLDGLIDLTLPTGLLCTAVLDHVADRDDPWGCLAHLVSGLAPGSYLALSHLTGDQMPPAGLAAIIRAYGNATDHIYPRRLADITRFFTGLEPVPPYEGADPELCTVGLWGAEDPVLADDASSRWRWAGVGRTTLEMRGRGGHS